MEEEKTIYLMREDKPNERSIRIPKCKDEEMLRATLIICIPGNTDVNYHYYLDVEAGYCMRLHKTDEPTGFSFSPRTTDPIVVKESHMTITVESDDDSVFLNILVPDNYAIGNSAFLPV